MLFFFFVIFSTYAVFQNIYIDWTFVQMYWWINMTILLRCESTWVVKYEKFCFKIHIFFLLFFCKQFFSVSSFFFLHAFDWRWHVEVKNYKYFVLLSSINDELFINKIAWIHDLFDTSATIQHESKNVNTMFSKAFIYYIFLHPNIIL